jgi:hypothetical protein
MEAEVETEKLGDRQPDKGVRKQKQADRGRQVRYARNHSCWQVGRMKAVAGSGWAKEGGRQGGKGLWAGKKRQADRCNMAGRIMQLSRDRGRQAGRQREADRRYRQAGKQVESSHAKAQKQEDVEAGR